MEEKTVLREINDKCDAILRKLEKLSGELGSAQSQAEDTVLDYLDVCQILHVSVRHLRRLNQNGELAGFKIGRRRFYLSSEVQAYLQRKNSGKHL